MRRPAGRAGRYLYISSRAVYAPPPPPGLDETRPTVEASPDADSTEYAQDKRGAEIAVEAAFGDRAVLARAGLILGPYEDVGRLPYWLLRIERGGEVLAPGPPDLPLQYIDARDLATWLLDAAIGSVSGPVNLVCLPGHTDTWAWLVATGRELPRPHGRPALGLDPAKDQAVLAAWRRRSPGPEVP